MSKRNGMHSISHGVCVLFLLCIGVFSSLPAETVSLSYKQIAHHSGEQSSGTIQLTLKNSSEEALEKCKLQLLFSSDVNVELREIPIAYLSSGGEITFVLPYTSATTLSEEEMLLSAELFLDDTLQKINLALLAMR